MDVASVGDTGLEVGFARQCVTELKDLAKIAVPGIPKTDLIRARARWACTLAYGIDPTVRLHRIPDVEGCVAIHRPLHPDDDPGLNWHLNHWSVRILHEVRPLTEAGGEVPDGTPDRLCDLARGLRECLEEPCVSQESTDRVARRPVGDGEISWEAAESALLAKRERGEPYTTLRALEAELGFSDGLIAKAIKKSDILKGWQARAWESKTPRAISINEVVTDRVCQTVEPASSDGPTDDEIGAALARLLDTATGEGRAWLNGLDDAGRRIVAVSDIESRREPSALQPDDSDRPRKVKHYTRA